MRALLDCRARMAAVCVVVVALTLACGSSSPAPTPMPTPTLSPAARFAQAPHGMVVSASSIASEVGRNVLAGGGNAVDAAVATGFALAVTYPTAGNIGGGGFMVVRFPDGRATAIDFREAAPEAARADMFLDSSGKYSYKIHHESYKSVGVPGTVAGFALAHSKYGKLSWNRVVDPAVKLASEGFAVPPGLAQSLSSMVRDFKNNPASLAEYTKNGTPYAAGEHIVLPDLGRTLARIRDQGR